MSEFRRDPFRGRWAIVASGRAARPNEYASRPSPDTSAAECPFCEGHERNTPPETSAVRPEGSPPDSPGWSVRAIPNRFPTVSAEAASGTPSRGTPFESEAAFGIHEVIVESPTHAPDLPYLSAKHLRTLFRFFRDRVRALDARPGLENVLLFENRGAESGGTLPHPHAQLVGTTRVPPRIEEERVAFRDEGRPDPAECRLESVVRAEARAAERVLAQDARYTAFAPFASEHPFEVWVVPSRHAPSYGAATDDEVDELARLLPRILRALDAVRPGASYNWFLHGERPGTPEANRFHWHLEIVPRLVRADGYEIGSGFLVNPVAPEVAAEELRSRMSDDLGTTVQQS